MIWADLHSHTTASDGTTKPADLVAMAKEIGLHGLCITDHDTVSAYPEAIKAAISCGLHLGSGIEFSAVFEGNDVHLLGYDFDLSSESIQTLCQKHRKRREKRNLEIVEKLRLNGMEIDLPHQEGVIGRPHIAYAMVLKGYVSSIKEAFHKFLGEGKKCYSQGERISVDETLDAIHAAHGKAFIAHPHLLHSSFPIDLLLQKPFDGIECYYGNLSQKSGERWRSIVQEKGWLFSGGSDFHGSNKPQISLGSQGVEKTVFDQIFTHPLT